MDYRRADYTVIKNDSVNEIIRGMQERPYFKAIMIEREIEPAEDFLKLCHAVINHPRMRALGFGSTSVLSESHYKQIVEWISKTSVDTKKVPISVLVFQKIQVPNGSWEAIFNAIKGNKSIAELSFDQVPPSLDLAKLIEQTVRSNTTLRTLKVKEDQREVSEAILNALKDNNTLTHVVLSRMNDSDCHTLGTSLQNNTALKSILLHNNCIEGPGLKHIYDLVNDNKTLISFGLSNNNLITEEGFQWIVQIMNNRKLKSLHLDNIGLTPEQSTNILEAVKINGTLQKFCLSSCELDSLATLIEDLLKTNTTLKSLELSKCNLQGKMESIASGLVNNKTLRMLSLENNSFHMLDYVALTEALRKNNGLTALNIRGSVVMSETLSYTLCDIVQRRRQLVDVQAHVKGWKYGYDSKLRQILKHNCAHQNEVVVNRVTIILNLARQKPQPLLPEIWAYIFSFIDTPDVYINWHFGIKRAFADPRRIDIAKNARWQ